jgi:hypothetical protein
LGHNTQLEHDVAGSNASRLLKKSRFGSFSGRWSGACPDGIQGDNTLARERI